MLEPEPLTPDPSHQHRKVHLISYYTFFSLFAHLYLARLALFSAVSITGLYKISLFQYLRFLNGSDFTEEGYVIPVKKCQLVVSTGK